MSEGLLALYGTVSSLRTKFLPAIQIRWRVKGPPVPLVRTFIMFSFYYCFRFPYFYELYLIEFMIFLGLPEVRNVARKSTTKNGQKSKKIVRYFSH